MTELIGKTFILEDGSPHTGAVVRIIEIENGRVIAEPVADEEGFAKVMVPITDLPRIRGHVEELQRRKDAREGLCQSCNGAGAIEGTVCLDCLGQGVLLFREEYDWLLTVANRADDAILDRQVFD